MREKILEKSMETALKALTGVATSEWVEERGLREPAQRLVQSGATMGIRAATRVLGQIKKRGPQKPKPKGPKQLFDLNPTEEQGLVIDALGRVAKELLAATAEEADEACAVPDDVIEIADDLGLAEAALPEALGGEGERSPMTTALVAEALGYGDMGLALALLAPSGVVNTLIDQATEAQKAAWLPPFGASRFVPASLALMEGGALANPHKPQTKAKKSGAGSCSRGRSPGCRSSSVPSSSWSPR